MDAGSFIGAALKAGCAAVLLFGIVIGLAIGCAGCHRPRDKETIVIPIPRDVPPPPHHR